jgi:hypothetical protein
MIPVQHFDPARYGTVLADYDFSRSERRTIDTGISNLTEPYSGLNATQSTPASQPTLSVAAQNGLDVASFDGTDDHMVAGAASSFNSVHNGDTVYLFLAGKPDVTTTRVYVGNGGASTLGRGHVVFSTTSLSQRVANGNGSTYSISSSNTMGGTNFFSATMKFDANSSPASTRSSIRFNGNTETANNSASAAPSALDANQALQIGRDWAANSASYSFYLDGTIGQIIYFSAFQQSTLLVQRVFGSLKWGTFS